MFPSAGDERRVKPGGVLIAVLAFVLTRTLLVRAVYTDPATSVVATTVRLGPLVLGLGLVSYGVSLAVSTHDAAYARTVATWFVVGSVGIFVMVALGAVGRPGPVATLRTDPVLANAVLGGGTGGILVGVRAARAQRRQRTLSRQSDQVVLLNRLLRHEVLNAITAIRGHAELLANGNDAHRSFPAIEDAVERIDRTIDQVGFLVRTVDQAAVALTAVDLAGVVRESVDGLPENASVSIDAPEGVRVRADEHLDTVLGGLVGAALERGPSHTASVEVVPGATTVDVSISAPGQWLNGTERRVLREGIREYEAQDVAYDVPISRLLVAQYGGTIDVVERNGETTVVVTLLRTAEHAPESDRQGVRGERLRNAAIAGIGAGIAMGLLLQTLTGEMGVIGALYGIRTAAVGWVTHLFHSVVFATVFVAAGSIDSLNRYTERLAGSVALGVMYGGILWLVAAGVVMGVWLNLVGIPASVPNLGAVSLLAHAVWGALVGALVFVLPAERE